MSSARPIPMRTWVISTQNDGGHQIIDSHGRGARLYTFVDYRLQTVVDTLAAPFLFFLQNVRYRSIGVNYRDLGGDRQLVGLQALEKTSQWTVRRTTIDLAGTLASISRSDTVTTTSAHDAVVTSAQTISCGDLTTNQDGVQEP
ncbi:hypothetical protein [Mycobacterium leprae]|nr:hypothetical protein [Mycobacterium leprae]